MLTHGSRARLQIGLERLGFLVDAIFTPELARQVLATDAALYDSLPLGIEADAKESPGDRREPSQAWMRRT